MKDWIVQIGQSLEGQKYTDVDEFAGNLFMDEICWYP